MASPHAAGAVALCIAGGACAGKTPAGIVQQLRSNAQARTVEGGWGFTDHPTSPITSCSPRRGCSSRYYGYLAYAGY